MIKSSIDCVQCNIILRGASAYLNLESVLGLQFNYSQGGPFFVFHPLGIRDHAHVPVGSYNEEYEFLHYKTVEFFTEPGNAPDP